MQAVESSESKKSGGEKIQTNGHAAPVQSPIFQSLTEDENRSQHNSRCEPRFHFALVVSTQSDFGSPDCKAAHKQADAENAGLEHIQKLRAGPAFRCRVVKKIREDQHTEEACFGKDERDYPGSVFFRPECIERASHWYHRIWTIGVRVIPERSSAA